VRGTGGRGGQRGKREHDRHAESDRLDALGPTRPHDAFAVSVAEGSVLLYDVDNDVCMSGHE
jgi:hypothetical protein